MYPDDWREDHEFLHLTYPSPAPNQPGSSKSSPLESAAPSPHSSSPSGSGSGLEQEQPQQWLPHGQLQAWRLARAPPSQVAN